RLVDVEGLAGAGGRVVVAVAVVDRLVGVVARAERPEGCRVGDGGGRGDRLVTAVQHVDVVRAGGAAQVRVERVGDRRAAVEAEAADTVGEGGRVVHGRAQGGLVGAVVDDRVVSIPLHGALPICRLVDVEGLAGAG